MKHKTNVQCVKALMERAKAGPLMQAFVMEAISRYADACAAADPETFNSPMLHGPSWHACAVEAKETLAAHFKS